SVAPRTPPSYGPPSRLVRSPPADTSTPCTFSAVGATISHDGTPAHSVVTVIASQQSPTTTPISLVAFALRDTPLNESEGPVTWSSPGATVPLTVSRAGVPAGASTATTTSISNPFSQSLSASSPSVNSSPSEGTTISTAQESPT